ncbi:MAG: hypothetical protein CM1200mP36_01100 [Gammaproteobacteria bacterium]|nr:MAG: hypothetical protein CM1200mP36_01100 [Gammaproteobacteria bacterium]
MGGSRVLSVGYLALVQEKDLAEAENSKWEDCFDYFPWEDWRAGRPGVVAEIESALLEWAGRRRQLRERVGICFGLGNAGWDAYKVLERYELLYEAQMIPEFWFDRGESVQSPMCARLGRPMAFDHRRILATALARVRGEAQVPPRRIRTDPGVFHFAAVAAGCGGADRFTLTQAEFQAASGAQWPS